MVKVASPQIAVVEVDPLYQEKALSLTECQQELHDDIKKAIFHSREWPYSTYVAGEEQYIQYLPANLEVIPYKKTGGPVERRFLSSQLQKLRSLAQELSAAFANSEKFDSEFRSSCYVNPYLENMSQSFRMRAQEFLILYTRYSAQMSSAGRLALQSEFAESVAIWFEHNFEQEWQRAKTDSFYGDAQYYHRVASIECVSARFSVGH